MDTAPPEPIRSWVERSPKARRAYRRLSADLDALAARLESLIPGHLRDAIAARIDPPGTTPTPPRDAAPALPEGPDSEPPPPDTTR